MWHVESGGTLQDVKHWQIIWDLATFINSAWNATHLCVCLLVILWLVNTALNKDTHLFTPTRSSQPLVMTNCLGFDPFCKFWIKRDTFMRSSLCMKVNFLWLLNSVVQKKTRIYSPNMSQQHDSFWKMACFPWLLASGGTQETRFLTNLAPFVNSAGNTTHWRVCLRVKRVILWF